MPNGLLDGPLCGLGDPMSRIRTFVVLIPAMLLTLNALAMLVAGGPCLPGEAGCVEP